MEDALRTLRPLRRVNSLPGSLADPAVVYEYPTALEDALYAPRQVFTTYDKGMLATPSMHKAAAAAAPAAVEAAEASADAGGEKVPAAPTEGSMTDECASSDGDAREEAVDNSTAAATATAAADGDKSDKRNSPEKAATEVADELPPSLRAVEVCEPYDAALMKERMWAHRSCRAHCPRGIALFLEGLAVKSPHGDGAAGDGFEFSGRGPSASLNSGKDALDAIGKMWEDRKDMPIPIGGPMRRRGLFGEPERKELHQMVIAVLNKVTTDPAKFREVRNELLRLPIPEASAEQLDDVVDVFFSKAVHEPHFCHSYADLVAAVCKVPQAEHTQLDPTLTFEYKLRHALVKRCQREFIADSQEDSSADAATTKERRDVMVGNVRFVCELFLRDIVRDGAISTIFLTCCTGAVSGDFRMPPTHTPTEAQIDEVIAAVQATALNYFRTPRGLAMLPPLIDNLAYWTEHHPISRCRFLLMTTTETLQGFQRELRGGGSPQQQQQQQQPGQGVRPAVAISAPKVFASPTAPALSTPKSTTTVGGKSLPVPRSQRAGSNASAASTPDGGASPTFAASTLDRSGSNVAVARPDLASSLGRTAQPVLSLPSDGRKGSGAVPALPAPAPARSPLSTQVTTVATAAPQLPPQSPPQPLVLKQPVRAEAVAKLMADFSTGAASAEATVAEVLQQYGDPLPVLGAWFDRCFSVVREEKTRLATGRLMEALAATGVVSRQDLRDAVFGALQSAVAQGLYEDLRVFKFWAQSILADHHRRALDEELLEDALEFLHDCCPEAVRAYLVEVGGVYAAVLAGDAFVPADAASGFTRYRPLLRLHVALSDGGRSGPELRAAVLALVDFPDARKHNLELDIYASLCGGKTSIEALFAKVRTAPRLPRDPTMAAAVLSAVLLAEAADPNGRSYLEDAVSLLLVAVDGVNRREREAAVVAEAHELVERLGLAPTLSSGARVVAKLRGFEIISDETAGHPRWCLPSPGDDGGVGHHQRSGAPSPPQQQQQQQQKATAATHLLEEKPAARPAALQQQQRPRTESLRSASEVNTSSCSSGRRATAPAGGASGSNNGGWRSSNASLRSNPSSPDYAQQQLRGGSGSGSGSYRRGGQTYNYRSGSGNDDGGAQPHRVTGYQRPGGARPVNRAKAGGRYNYQAGSGGGDAAGGSGSGGGQFFQGRGGGGEGRRR